MDKQSHSILFWITVRKIVLFIQTMNGWNNFWYRILFEFVLKVSADRICKCMEEIKLPIRISICVVETYRNHLEKGFFMDKQNQDKPFCRVCRGPLFDALYLKTCLLWCSKSENESTQYKWVRFQYGKTNCRVSRYGWIRSILIVWF